ncbi:caspase-3-like [Cyprinodon tularosa]|uniref:Caspase family p20 domain-containing protein n=1 Tax=Cyprinodon variegatus TaxID=28743 RepID=A0A3Q2DEI7_CYPVA|nr:PREDICTED: caspase-3-like [Cyprinodon variegatus]XP_038132511.1 caspase-3-like [Cyprinodon tularosa]
MPLWRGLRDSPEERNRAVVVSVAKFYPGVELGKRPGAEKDAKRLHRNLSKLGFKVDLHSDLSGEEIYQLFSAESRRPVKDCFLAVLSSHGEEGCVFGADGEPVRLSRIFTFFDNECMEKKTKLFLIQACRGHHLDDGVEVDSAQEESDSSFSHYLSVPTDTAVMYATAPGYGAFMNFSGSVFLQTFCSLLEEEGHCELELTRLLTRLSHRVAYSFQAKGRLYDGKKEMPCLVTRLTREVFPFADSEEDSKAGKISATSLVSLRSVRARIASLS